jgi:hypothetical protein
MGAIPAMRSTAVHGREGVTQIGASVNGQEQSVIMLASNVSSSAKGDNGFSIYRVRCTRKIGRWLASRS